MAIYGIQRVQEKTLLFKASTLLKDNQKILRNVFFVSG
jgi:hypothetical protein